MSRRSWTLPTRDAPCLTPAGWRALQLHPL